MTSAAPELSPPGITATADTEKGPRVLEFTWSPSWDGFAVSNVRCEIEPTTTGSRLTLVYTGFATADMTKGHGEGWVRVLGWLRKFAVANG